MTRKYELLQYFINLILNTLGDVIMCFIIINPNHTHRTKPP